MTFQKLQREKAVPNSKEEFLDLVYEIKNEFEKIFTEEELNGYWRYEELIKVMNDFKAEKFDEDTTVGITRMGCEELDDKPELLDKLSRLAFWYRNLGYIRNTANRFWGY